jgi:hypothetical protein
MLQAAASGDSTAMMNYYMRKAAEKESNKGENRSPDRSDTREMPPPRDLTKSSGGNAPGHSGADRGGLAPECSPNVP